MARLSRPNILFILSDQHSPRALGCLGRHVLVRTPCLDRLAREGAIFDNAYCQNPICVPSRYSIITGQYSKTLGVYDNRQILDPASITIPRVLGQAGYRTCLIGKAHFNGEQYQGYQERPYGDLWGQAHQPDPIRTNEKGEAGYGKLLDQAGASGIPRLLTQTEICSFEAVKWLQIHLAQHPDRPFFLSLHYEKPHQPFNPPPELFEFYRKKVKLPPVPKDFFKNMLPGLQQFYRRQNYHLEPPELHLKALAAYYGCIEWTDAAVGQVMDALKYLGLEENTIVIYTSDHGEMASEHRLWQKSVFFDSSVRVPLLVRWPGKIRAGRRHAEPTGLVDLFPTLCEAAGAPVPETCDGTSLLPLLVKGEKPERDAIFSETLLTPPLEDPPNAGCMIRTGKWKYNLYLDETEELYDLQRDPNEWNNLADSADHRRVVGGLRDRVRRFWNPEKFAEHYASVPHVRINKHCYWYSNQYVVGNGMIVDARP